MTEARWNELRRILAKLVGKLDPRERTIIRQRFGLENANPVRTLQSLAKDMGVCKERVRQLEARAMNKLRMMAVEVKLAPPEDA
jgi:RNA polymerase sigma factor (sigma-70 family)